MPLPLAMLVCTLVYLDSWPVGQFMLGRPALLLPVLGLLCGDPLIGVWLGLVLELLTLRALPMGSALPPDPALAGAFSLLGLGLGSPSALDSMPESTGVLLALLIAVPLCWVAPWLTEAQRRINGRLWRPMFQSAVLAGDSARCNRLMAFTMGQTILLGAAVSGLVLAGVATLSPMLSPLTDRLAEGRLSRILPLPWALVAVALGGLWRHAAGRLGNRALWSGAAIGLVLVWLSWRMT